MALWLFRLANSREVRLCRQSSASRPSHDGASNWIDHAIRWAREQAGFLRVRLRGRYGLLSDRTLRSLNASDVEFVFGIDAHRSFVKRAKALEEQAWGPLKRRSKKRKTQRRRPKNVRQEVVERKGFKDLVLEQEHVAEMEYRRRRRRQLTA